MKTFFFLFIAFIGVVSATSELFRSKATLDVLGGFSSITDDQFDSDPNLAVALHANIAGGFNSEYVTDSRVVTCYENGPALYDNVYASCLVFDVSGTTPVVLDRINITGNVGVSNGAPSPSSSRQYVVRSFYQVTPILPYYPYLTEFRLDVTAYNLNSGTFENTPRLNINFNTINSDLFTLTPAYSGVSGVSDDGRFVFYTLGVGTRLVSIPTPGGILTLPVPSTQVYGILELSTDGTTYTKRVEIQANPAALPPPYLSFTQGAQMRPLADGHRYLCVVAANTYAGLLDPLGKNAHVITYIFDTATNSLTLKGAQPVPQYIQGFDLSADNQHIAIVTNLALSKLANDPRLPYPNVAPNKSDNIRLYTVDQTVHNVTLASTSSLFADGIQVRFGPKKTVFVTQAPDIYDTVVPSPFPPNPALLLGTTVKIYSSNFLQTLIIKDDVMIPQTTAGIAPLSFGVAVNSDESRVFTSGTPTPFKKSEALFSVVKNN